MGILDSLEPEVYTKCPKCGIGEIEEETSGKWFNFTIDNVYCNECGHEPERNDVLKHTNGTTGDSVYVCRECHEQVSPDVQRCPNCGWKPEKKGGLWWGVTALMSFNPIGWAMGAKGASDGIKATKGVAKKVNKTDKLSDSEPEENNSKAPTDKLDELNELREKGVITEEEFEKKKKELLEKI